MLSLYDFSSQCLCMLQRRGRQSRMFSTTNTHRFTGYDEAIKALSNLEKRPVLKDVPPEKSSTPKERLDVMRRLIKASGISKEALEGLNVIHIAGTKGKGSTCAMVESIIRKSGPIKTGFYSSPHLVSTTERIRINGQSLSQEKFCHYFWPLYEKIEHVPERIFFFKFLTLMALKVFISEKVDVAILEVGIGGTYDCTNVIDKPLACGITNLGLDHTSMLGSTIQGIAWHKSGICKAGVPLFVDSHQFPEAMAVIKERAKEIGSPFFPAPDFEDYDWRGIPPVLSLEGQVQQRNAALALQISQYYLSTLKCGSLSPGKPFAPSDGHRDGLAGVSWPGRFQTVSLDSAHCLYLDAAHTKESMEACCAWVSQKSSSSLTALRVLLFNATRDHDSETMLKNLKSSLSFDVVIFCTNVIEPDQQIHDNTYPPDVFQKMSDRCLRHKDLWLSLGEEPRERVLVMPYICHALLWLLGREFKALRDHYGGQEVFTLGGTKCDPPLERTQDRMEILVTGSLHLVGDVMKTLGIEPTST